MCVELCRLKHATCVVFSAVGCSLWEDLVLQAIHTSQNGLEKFDLGNQRCYQIGDIIALVESVLKKDLSIRSPATGIV
ncbi:hypothetical protein TNCV_1593151 [Trichonephila clavipes]|nr:hypothetical protein TNCV_1593151 [Trichonephila clavipes]